jgi:hypothetical protein
LKLIPSKNGATAERKRSLDKSLCALRKTVVEGFGASICIELGWGWQE